MILLCMLSFPSMQKIKGRVVVEAPGKIVRTGTDENGCLLTIYDDGSAIAVATDIDGNIYVDCNEDRVLVVAGVKDGVTTVRVVKPSSGGTA